MCFSLFLVTSIHSIQNSAKDKYSEARWKVTQKIQLFVTQKTGKLDWKVKRPKKKCSKEETDWYTMWK